MTNSGSSANLISTSLFYKRKNPFKFGDEVIVPGVSWLPYHPLQQYGLKLKFVDININTLNMIMNYSRVKPLKMKLIVAVSILGNPHLG